MDLLKPRIDNENQTVNILLGPKLGDLFQMLVVPQYLWKFFGIKSNIYITEVFDTFTTGLQDTFESLEPIIKAQKFTNSFEIFNSSLHTIQIDLNNFRINGTWGNRPFCSVFLDTAFGPHCHMPKNLNYIEWDKNQEFSDYLVVHRKDLFEFNSFVEKQYRTVFEKFDKKVFMTFDEKLYDSFPLKKHLDVLVVKDLGEQLSIINGCKVSMHNGTGTLCMATALNSPRIGEVGKWLNVVCGLDHMFFDNAEFFDKHKVLSPFPKYLRLY